MESSQPTKEVQHSWQLRQQDFLASGHLVRMHYRLCHHRSLRSGATFSSIQRFIIAHFSWFILLTGASAIFFSVWMACSSRFATVKLGAADEKPEFSFFAWVAMLFCAALGTGFVIFGAARAALSPVHRPHGHGCRERLGRSGRPRGHPALRSELGPIRLAAVRRRWMGYRVCGLSP